MIEAGGSLAVVVVEKDPGIELFPTENMKCVDPGNSFSKATWTWFPKFSLSSHPCEVLGKIYVLDSFFMNGLDWMWKKGLVQFSFSPDQWWFVLQLH